MTTLNSGPPGQPATQTQPVSPRIPAILGGKFFNKLKIGSKLTFGFGLLVALTLLVIGLSYLGSYRATTNINRTGDVRVPTALASARAQANMLRMLADVQAYLALGDDTYQSSYHQARQAFEGDLARLDELARQHAASASNPEFDRRLNALKSAYAEWSALPEQLFDLRNDQLKREPALRLLIEEANPLIVPILVDINAIITTQRQREPSAENMALLGDMANFQASFFAMVAGLRGYVTTGRDSFQFEYTSNLTVNDSAWEELVNQQARLESNQREKLHNISQARAAFLALPPQMFEAVRGEHAREDLFLFRTQAVPLAETALRLLAELTADEQNLLQADLSEGREQLAAAQWQTLAGGVAALLLGLGLAFVFRENIAGPIRRLTTVAAQIGAGDLTAQAPIESGDEIGTLAATFNQMTSQLRQTLEDLEQRRNELHVAAETLRGQNEYLSALHDTSLGLLNRLDLSELLEALVTRAGHLLDAPHGVIYLVESGAGVLERKVGVGIFSQALGFHVKPGEGLAGRVWQSGQPLVIDDYDTWPERLSNFESGVIGAMMGVPLIQSMDSGTAGSQVVGVIGMAYDVESDRTFGEAEVELLSRFAQLASVALDNARLFAETEQRAAELAIINSVSEGLVKGLDFQAIIDLVGDKIREIFQVEYYFIALYDQQTQLIHWPYCRHRDRRLFWEPADFGSGLTSHVIQSRRPLSLGTLEQMLELGINLPEDLEEMPQSWLGMPIIVGDKVTGVIAVQSAEPHAYHDSHIRLLSTLAANLGAALENARLFAETKRLLEETQQRSAELTIINSVGEAMARNLDVPTVTRIVGDKVREIFQVEATEILLLDPQTNLIHVPYSYYRGYRDDYYFPLDEGLTSRVISSRQPLVLGTLQAQFESGVIYRGPKNDKMGDLNRTESYMGVPIIIGDKVLGVVSVQSYQQHAYDENSIRLLSTLSANMGVAIENARLFEETKRLLAETEQRAAELAIINSVGEAMARNLDVQTVTHIVGDKVREIFQVEATDILLLDPQTNLIHTLYSNYRGYHDSETFTFPLGEGLTSRVIVSRQPLVLGTLQAQIENGVLFNEEVGELDRTESYLAVPIIVGDKILGVVSVQSYQQHAYDENSVRLLSTLSANMGVAIENARLFQAERAQAGRQAALFRLSAAIAAALDEDEICRRVVEGLQDEALGYAYVAAFLVDPAIGERVERASIGVSGAATPLRMRPGQGLSERALLDGQLHYTADVTQAKGYVPSLSSGSEVDAPLKIDQEVVGVLVVESRQPDAFGQDDFDVITAAANQAGVALGRARLLEETKKAREAAETAAQELSQALENLKATQAQLVEAEKMAALGGLVAGVAHEINTPVGVGVTAASLLEEKTRIFHETYQSGQMKRSDLEKYLDLASQSSQMILSNLHRAAELIQSFKQVAVDQSSEERRIFRVKTYLDEILLSLHPKLKRTQLALEIHADDHLTLDSYPGTFAQIVTNLVMNSLIHAYEPGEPGRLVFDLKQQDGRFIFEYADDGRGIPKKHLGKIFDPFFTTKRGQGGSGLGLHIIYNLVTQKLGGTIRCESAVGIGTKFVIEVPTQIRN